MRFLSNFGCKTILGFQLIVRKHWSRDLLVQVAICLAK